MAQSQDFARAFHDRFGKDWPVIIAPLTEIRDTPDRLETEGCAALAFTSANAVVAHGRNGAGRRLPAYCVGPATATAARAHGHEIVAVEENAASLVVRISADRPGRIGWPRGRQASVDLKDALESAGIETVSAILYAQEDCPPSEALIAAVARREPVLLPLFSPASASRAVAALRGARAEFLVAAMSPRVAVAAEPLHPARVALAQQPNGAAMLAALSALIAAGRCA